MRAQEEGAGRAGKVFDILHDGRCERPEVRQSLRRFAVALVDAFDTYAADLRAGRRPPLSRR